MALYKKISNNYISNNSFRKNINAYSLELKNVYRKLNNKYLPIYTYSWEIGSWSTCSKPCGTGTQTRSVRCKRSDGSIKNDTFCSDVTKPITSQNCNTHTCLTVIGCKGLDLTNFKDATLLLTGYIDLPWKGKYNHDTASFTIPNNGAYIYIYQRAWVSDITYGRAHHCISLDIDGTIVKSIGRCGEYDCSDLKEVEDNCVLVNTHWDGCQQTNFNALFEVIYPVIAGQNVIVKLFHGSYGKKGRRGAKIEFVKFLVTDNKI